MYPMSQIPSKPMEYFTFNQKEFDYKYVVMLSDIDQFKHMSFANYLKLMFLASDALFLAFSKTHQDFFDKTHLKPLLSQMHFKHQTAFGDEILVKVHSANITPRGFILYYRFTTEGDALPVAHGRQEFEAMEVETGKKIIVPESLKSFLSTIQMDASENFSDIKPTGEFSVKNVAGNSKVFSFNKCVVFFKHTNQLGFAHPYNFMEWTSYVREAYFQETVSNFMEVLQRPIKMMTTKISSAVLNDSEFGDTFEARLTVGKIKKVSFDMIIRFVNIKKREVACETVHTIVFVDTKAASFAPIPKEMLDVIVNYQEPEIVR